MGLLLHSLLDGRRLAECHIGDTESDRAHELAAAIRRCLSSRVDLALIVTVTANIAASNGYPGVEELDAAIDAMGAE